jgi:hypothetical protein
MVLDDDGQGMYSTGFGHGDAMHVADMDPTNRGLEVWQIHEPSGVPGADFRDAQDGRAFFTTAINSGEGPGRGVAADVWAGSPGYEMWGTGGLLNTEGNNIGRAPSTANFLVWWDADPVRELLDGQNSGNGSPRIDKYGTSFDTRLLTMTGALTNNGTKANPSLSGDIFGDWREEVIVRASDNQSLRIYTTTIPSTTRLFTLMHDSQYRVAISWQNAGYNQPPHPSFFVGAGMEAPPQPAIFFGGDLKGDYNADGKVNAADYVVWRNALGTANASADGNHDGVVGPADYGMWQNHFGAAAVAAAGSGQSIAAATASAPRDTVGASRNYLATDRTQTEPSFSARRFIHTEAQSPRIASHRSADLLLGLKSPPAEDVELESSSFSRRDASAENPAMSTRVAALDEAFAALRAGVAFGRL